MSTNTISKALFTKVNRNINLLFPIAIKVCEFKACKHFSSPIINLKNVLTKDKFIQTAHATIPHHPHDGKYGYRRTLKLFIHT